MKLEDKKANSISIFRVTKLQEFHNSTQIDSFDGALDKKLWPEDWKKINFKAYPRLPLLKLSRPNFDSTITLKDALLTRYSGRNFSGRPLTETDISNLLYYSSGIKDSTLSGIGRRFYPSAGARYPLEIYPLVLKSKGKIKSGVYHYYVKRHSLEYLVKLPSDLNRYISFKEIDKASMVLIISAVFRRSEVKYGDRGYRYMFLEAGHLCQNIYLLCSALGFECCAIGGYSDVALNRLLDFEEPLEAVVYTVAIGGLRGSL